MRTVIKLLGAALLLSACTAAPPPTYNQPRTKDTPNEQQEETNGTDPNGTDTGTSKPPANRPAIDAFPGTKIFLPPKTPAPGIVMLHGSEGGSEPYIRQFAAEIAQQGFVVVTYCWFGCTGKPPTILRIPLESVVEIGQWLEGAPEVANGKVGLFGWSRGAEMSLLLTSLLQGTDLYRAVAVHAPSDTVVAAFDPATQDNPPSYGGIDETDAKTGTTIPAPSWTWKGQALYGEPKIDWSAKGPRIFVEKYPGPVYVSQGEQDEVWEVARGKAVVATRNAAGKNLVTESHFFPGEGHVLMQQANITAQRNEIVSFFQRNLK